MSAGLTRSILRRGWPSPMIDRLLRAIALPDTAAATAAWRDFEKAADFDRLTAGQFRLISLAAGRIDALMGTSPMRARIAGIERAVWSRSRLSVAEAGSGLAALASAGIALLAIKGAGRAASGDRRLRGRAVNDIDLVIPPADLERAYDLLVADGWTPSGSGSALYQRTQLAAATGINLVRGRFGNLDLHRTAFHPPFECEAEDGAIWDRALPGRLGETALRFPSPTDVVVIALAHGTLDAHKTSDWLLDIAQSIEAGLDWDLLLHLVRRRGLEAAAAIALGYAQERLASPVPAGVLDRLARAAGRRPVRLLAIAAQARPKELATGFFWLARGLAKQARLQRTRRQKRDRPPVMASPVAELRTVEAGVLRQPLPLPGRRAGEPWTGRIDLTLAVDPPPLSRRIDFEVNTEDAHLLRLRVRARGGAGAAYRFRFPLTLSAGDGDPVLVAVPSRGFNDGAPPAAMARYGALPFGLVALKATRQARG